MILIFGGTTEGRLAADLCDTSGQPFYYSTRGDHQSVSLRHGVRLSGEMSSDDIRRFCHNNGVRCIIDAAHPFAIRLHESIAALHLPVVRLQRCFGERVADAVYCRDYEEAMEQMRRAGVRRLLALSGANTISRLKPYWSERPTVFRILRRPESIDIARRQGLPADSIIFYNDDLHLPTAHDERLLMESVGCDAIITKESGESGGFESKVEAARQLGVKVFVVERPTLPPDWHYVTGRHSLRRAIQRLVPDFFPLKTGLTTGACATAASKAAALSLLHDARPEEVSFALPDGEVLTVPVELEGRGVASVVKDESDDPDVTKGCRITATVSYGSPEQREAVVFRRGEGVGIVTLPGLGIEVGEPAINPVPRQMIISHLSSLTSEPLEVMISVEGGRLLAQKTFNPKVGVVDGISIIGTSGIVSPLSHEAFIHSIRRELEVARAIRATAIGIVSGKLSEEALRQRYPNLRIIHYGNFVGETLQQAHQLRFERVIIGIGIGKAVKLAEGYLDTHSHRVTLNKSFLHRLVSDLDDAPRLASVIDSVTMARQLYDQMPSIFFDRIVSLCQSHCQKVFPDGDVTVELIRQ